MTAEEEILKELREQTAYIKATYAILGDIKFELVNARITTSESTYKIPIPKKKGVIRTVHEKIQSLLKRE